MGVICSREAGERDQKSYKTMINELSRRGLWNISSYNIAQRKESRT